MNRGLHFRKHIQRFLFAGLLAVAFVSTEAKAVAAVRCEDLFRTLLPSEAKMPSLSSRVDAKFANSEVAKVFLRILDADVREQARVWARLNPLAGKELESYEIEIAALQTRGLRVTNLNVDLVIFQGNADLVISALRQPATDIVLRAESGGPSRNRWPHFSRVIPKVHPARWLTLVSSKFEWPDFYSSFRTKVLGATGQLYQLQVETSGLVRGTSAFSRFIEDIRNLGLSVDPASLEKGAELLTFSGPIDIIYTVLRHPVIVKVVRVEQFFSEQQILEKKNTETEFRDWLKSDYFRIRDIPKGIVLPGQSHVGWRFQAFRDREIPSLIRIQDARSLKSIIPHEVQTAKDYAKFVRKNFGEDFAFLAEFDGMSVPIFDGVILNRKSHAVLANVSLKYNSEAVEAATLERLTEDVEARFYEFRRKKKILTQPDEWFRVVNNLPTDSLSLALPYYETALRRALTLSTLFGLFTTGDAGAKEARIVVDIRDHGFTFDFFRDPAVQKQLRDKFVATANRYHTSMTLLWNDRQAVEIRREGVKLYE